MLQQRTARHDLFNGQNVGAENKRFQLKAVEFLLGTTNRLDDIIVLGMITQLSPGTYYLGRVGEDKNSVHIIRLDCCFQRTPVVLCSWT